MSVRDGSCGGGGGGGLLTLAAVKVCDAEDISGTALRGTVQAVGAGVEELALLDLDGGEGEGGAGEEGDEGGGELHGCCLGGLVDLCGSGSGWCLED